MYNIINELNLENGSNYKMGVLKKHQDNKLLKRLLKMTYDKVSYTYGITMKNIPEVESGGVMELSMALDILEERFVTRMWTGNKAIAELHNILECLSPEDADIIKKVINRDLRINIGRTNINKVWKNLIVKPPYMRCSLMDKLDRIEYPAISTLKEDGTYRTVIIDNKDITIMARSGEEDEFPLFKERLRGLPDGVYIGELLIRSLPGSVNRLKANGLINSDIEQPDMYFSTWDYLTISEWNCKVSDVYYIKRFEKLIENIKVSDLFLNQDTIQTVSYKIVKSFEEAKEHYKELVDSGEEGTVLKNLKTPFKDHTSPTQIKIKEEAVAEFVIVDFQEGEGRLQGTLGAMYYVSSDNQVAGKMGGFSDDMRDYIWENRESLKGSIVSVKYNGVTKARGKETFSLMFANFVELRPEKDTADDLKYIKNALK